MSTQQRMELADGAPGRVISVVIPTWRDSNRAAMLMEELRLQQLPDGWSRQIVVVDDGSGPPHSKVLAKSAGQDVTVVSLARNAGRSTAVATGIDRASGELLMVIDADCLPADRNLLVTHIQAMTDHRVVASNGPVRGYDDRFWSRYQDDVVRHRAGRRDAMPGTVGSTANSCIRRQTYLDVGGLDRNYTGYGFEDRDLLLRLAERGWIAWTPGAVVKHMDVLTLVSVCAKVTEAGRGNSMLFSRRHPVAYRSLGFARFDARGRWGRKLVGRVIGRVVPRTAALLDPCLDHLPFQVSRLLVKILSALAFLAGTSRAEASTRNRPERSPSA